MATKKNDIVKTDAEIIDANFDVVTEFINTFDLSTNAGKMKVVNAMNNAVSLNDHMNEELHITDCITMPGTRKGRGNAPDSECKNVYIIDTDGVSYFSQSDGVARAVQTFASLWSDFGKQTTEEGYLRVKCVAQDLPNGNTLKTLIFCD